MAKATCEKWLPVTGYEGLYEVSSFGRVKSKKRNTTNGGILKGHVNKRNGYVYVSLSKHGKTQFVRLHRIVLTAFSPPTNSDANQVNHKDGIKTNNTLENLEWVTSSENMKHAFANNLVSLCCKKVIDINTNEIFDSMGDAARSVGGKNVSSITKVCMGERSNYRNHKFAYLEDYEKGIIRCNNVKHPKRSCESLWR